MTVRDNAELLRTIDAVAPGRVLVYGSLPPEGRDLDLLVRPLEASAIAGRLRSEGFRAWGRGWVLFEGCFASLVELIPAATLRLPETELDALFAEASPLPRLTRLVEPAPHHALLILARRLAGQAFLQPKHRARIDRAVALDPLAWERAQDRADLWTADTALGRLARLQGQSRAGSRFSRQSLRRPRRARVIALAGANPDRKRLHAEFLRETLERLGFDVVVERPCSWRFDPGTREQPEQGREVSLAGAPRVHAFRAPLVATAAALSLWWPVWRRLAQGTVVIYERSALDVAVSLSRGGGAPGGLTRSARLLRLLAPTPMRSYLFEETASPRHGHATERPRPEAYHAASPAFAARPLEAGRRTDDVCAQIAEDVWRALTRRTAFASWLRSVALAGRRLRRS